VPAIYHLFKKQSCPWNCFASETVYFQKRKVISPIVTIKIYTKAQKRVEFNIQSFPTLVLSPSDFHKIRGKEGRTLPMVVNVIAVTPAP
jgi:hypothetical protein